MQQGAIADVYLGQDEALQRQVVLKLLRSDYTAYPARRQQFQQEAEMLAQLKHPHIVQLFSIDVMAGERPYMVLPYIDGGTVRKELDRLRFQKDVMPVVTALDMVHQVADAILLLHNEQRVHGAIQPDHVLLRREKTAVLPSLGRAYWTDLPVPSSWPLYAAPEQVGGGVIDGRADIYGMGVLLYELLTGQYPFPDPQAWPMQPVPVHSHRANCAAETTNLVHRCLAAQPDERYQSVPDLLTALEAAGLAEGGRPYTSLANVWQVYPDQQQVVRKDDLLTPTPVTKPAQPERRWPVYLVVALVLVAIFAAGWWSFTGQTRSGGDQTAVANLDGTEAASPTILPMEAATPAPVMPTSTLAPIPTDTPTPLPSPTPTITPTATRFLGPETLEIGRSVLDQPIAAVRFGDGEDVLILIGGLHAGYSPASVQLAEETITYLTENMDLVADNITVYVIPSANPDAVKAPGVREGRLNANGVDLNRNWGCRWQAEAEWNRQPVSGGSQVFSEPETAALRDFILNHQPQGVVFWEAKAADGLSSPGACGVRPVVSADLAEIYGEAAGYEVADFEVIANTLINGDGTNWLDSQAVPSIAVLLPDYDEMDWENNQPAILALLEAFAREDGS
ncbi:MAG: protein kinase, partial [Anaerolineae bacterium]